MQASSYSFPLSVVTELFSHIILQRMEKKQTVHCTLPAIRIRILAILPGNTKKVPATMAGNGSIAHQTCFNISAYGVYVEKHTGIMLNDLAQAMQTEALMSRLRG